jgi:hypothetical protein
MATTGQPARAILVVFRPNLPFAMVLTNLEKIAVDDKRQIFVFGNWSMIQKRDKNSAI